MLSQQTFITQRFPKQGEEMGLKTQFECSTKLVSSQADNDRLCVFLREGPHNPLPRTAIPALPTQTTGVYCLSRAKMVASGMPGSSSTTRSQVCESRTLQSQPKGVTLATPRWYPLLVRRQEFPLVHLSRKCQGGHREHQTYPLGRFSGECWAPLLFPS